jgi:O-antigen biosynthesis protein
MNYGLYFDPDYYRGMYADVHLAGIDPLAHFNESGWKEHRNPSVHFDTYFYKQKYLQGEQTSINPLVHFLRIGMKSGNAPRPKNALSLVSGQKPVAGSVAIHCHVFYLSLFPEICACLSDLTLDYTLYVTVCSQPDVAAALSYARETLPPNAKIDVRLVPNKGRDLGPLFVGLADVLEKHDVWCHLHTKYSPHTHFGARWRTYLLDQLIGSDERVNSILKLLELESPYGLVYPQNKIRQPWREPPHP